MNGESIFGSFDIAASGLSVQRRRMEAISKNLANVDTTRTEDGGPYRKERVLVREIDQRNIFYRMLNRLRTTNSKHVNHSHFDLNSYIAAGGAEIESIEKDTSPPRLKYDPNHPDADNNGYVHLPDIHVISEMVDMITATRAYEANLTVIDAAKNIIKKSLEI